MSMINDALRRASSAAKATPGASPETPATPPALPLPPMPLPESEEASQPEPPVSRAVPPPPLPLPNRDISFPAPPALRVEPTRKKSVLPIFLILLFLFCCAGTAGMFVWKQKHPLTVTAVERDEKPSPVNAAGDPAFSDRKGQPETSVVIDHTNAVASSQIGTDAGKKPTPKAVAAAASSPASPAASAVKFPPLRLQSIFYRPKSPSVIINGKTLYVSDEISGVTVADIQPANVTLVLSGQTNVLTLR